jgi:hypothetical protein
VTRLTTEEHAAGIKRSDEEITTAFSNLIKRKGIMSIPVQREDDVTRSANCANRASA